MSVPRIKRIAVSSTSYGPVLFALGSDGAVYSLVTERVGSGARPSNWVKLPPLPPYAAPDPAAVPRKEI